MNEQTWLSSDDPLAMLRFLTHEERCVPVLGAEDGPRDRPLASDRQLRLLVRRFAFMEGVTTVDTPTKEQVLAEPAGPRLDAWVEQFLFGRELYWHETHRGWVWDSDAGGVCGVSNGYSGTWDGAGRVIDRLGSLVRASWTLRSGCPDYEFAAHGDGGGMVRRLVAARAASAPEAVCKAALLVALGHVLGPAADLG